MIGILWLAGAYAPSGWGPWRPLVGALILIPLQTATNTWFGGGGSGLTYILYGGIIVILEDGHILDTILQRLAAYLEKSAELARKIEEQLTYPGQIKVTVIRETRAVEYAK